MPTDFHWVPAGKLGGDQATTRGFCLAETETSQRLWRGVMGWNRSYNQGDALPVERVSWNDCQEFIAKIQRFATEGYRFRLPNEDEWEYACRAGTATRYAFGDAWNDAFANNGGGTLPCGSYSFANAWGLKDMHGNGARISAATTFSRTESSDVFCAEEDGAAGPLTAARLDEAICPPHGEPIISDFDCF